MAYLPWDRPAPERKKSPRSYRGLSLWPGRSQLSRYISVVAHIKNPRVRSFWEQEYPHYTDRLEAEAISPIQNKVGQLTLPTTLQNILGQPQSKIDFSHIMDSGKIFIANLDKGRLGETSTSFLGSLIVTGFQVAAMQRVDDLDEQEEEGRGEFPPFYQ